MIESIEWTSFGLGAGGAYAYLHLWLRYPEMGDFFRKWASRRRARADLRRTHLVTDLRRIQMLERKVVAAEAEVEEERRKREEVRDYSIGFIKAMKEELARLQSEKDRLQAQDAKWKAYKERNALNQQVKSVVTLYSASKKELPVGRGASSPPVQAVCDRGLCYLKKDHDGRCVV